MAKRKVKAKRSPVRTHHSQEENPSIIIQLGVVFIIVAAMLLAGYVGGLYMK